MAEQLQPGAASNPPAVSADDTAKQLEEMKKLLAAKDAEIAALKNKDASTADGSGGADDDADDDAKAPPKTDVTLSLRGIPEYDTYPYAQSADKFIFMASIKAPYFRAEDRAPIDLVAVVDESGSMSGERIRLVKETVQFIIKNLESGDRFGIVGYSSGSRTVLPLTKMDDAGKKKASALGNKLRASGGTALCEGLVVGVNMMRNRTFKNDVASVMILTDGQANQGPTSAPDIIRSVLSGKVESKFNRYGYGGGHPPPPPSNFNPYMNQIPMQMQQQPIMPQQFQQQFQQQGMPQQQQIQGRPAQTAPMFRGRKKASKKKKVLQQAPAPPQGPPPPQIVSQMQVQGNVQVTSFQGQAPPQLQAQSQPQIAPQMQSQVQGNVQVTGGSLQGQAPPQLQAQSQPQGQAKPDMIEDTEDEKQQKEGAQDQSSKELPCTINTFGFGTGHNADLLQAISESGRGMYAFIETTDSIADTFAECLGGLVSMVGQDLQVKIEALNNVEINKCLSKGLPLSVTRPRKVHTVTIKDLQSEESRDLVFELKLPAIGAAKESDPIIQLSVAYKNVVKDVRETLSNVCSIARIEGSQKGERNMELDVQYNRVMAADAMERADELANKGKMEEARKLLKFQMASIQASPSNAQAYSVNLVNDMQTISSNMQNTQQYHSRGRKMMKSQYQAQQMQRSAQSSQWASQSCYENRSKKAMKKKFKR